MKILINICLLSIVLSSCGGDDIIYPATYDFDANVEIGTSIITKEANGNLVEVPAVQSLNSSLCDFFETIQSNQEVTSLTLISESEMELTIDNGTGMNSVFTAPYSVQGDVILEDFGLSFDENNNIVSKICNTYTFAPSENVLLAESNFCNIKTPPYDQVVIDFFGEGYKQGDTLGLCLIQKVYKLR